MEKLEGAQLGFNMEGCSCGILMHAEDMLMADSGVELQFMLDMVATSIHVKVEDEL